MAALPSDEQHAEYEKCRADICYWFDTYVWTYNPKLGAGERWIKFTLFAKQREYLAWKQGRIDSHEDGVLEKSRDVGATWLNVGFQLHKWIFEDDFKGGFGSATEAKLDRLGDPDTILEKGRLLLRRLPGWMLPKGFDDRKHCGFLKFINPENGSTITGEAGDNIGRGGRNVVYDLDEAAFIERAEKVEAALSQNCDTVIWTSTVNGVGNTFWKKRFGGSVSVFVIDWRDDPRKTQAWYDAQAERFKHEPSVMASEVDRDYTASVEGVVIPGKWVQAAIDAVEALRIPLLGGKKAAADIAAGGANKTVFGACTGVVVHSLKEWGEENTTINAYNLRDETRAVGATVLNYDANGIGIACKSTWALDPSLGFKTNGIMGGASPSEAVWPDDRTSKELFYNYRAEIAWGLRERFRKTYEMRESIANHPFEDLISIPFHAELIAQLSMPIGKRAPNGKRIVESKEDMRRRGVISPDWFDFLMYLFAPEPETPLAPMHVTSTEMATDVYQVFGFESDGKPYQAPY